MARTERGWLRDFGKDIAVRLAEIPTLPQSMLVAPAEIRTEVTNTGGWLTEIARVPTGRGDQLQIWFDEYTLSDGRRLNLCYKTPRPDRARQLAASGIGAVSSARFVKDDFAELVGKDNWRMKRRLAPSEFRKPFAELYENSASWSFIGTYLPQSIDPARGASKLLLGECVQFFARLLRSIMVHHSEAKADIAYPEANRVKVRRHLQRERSGALVTLAKLRDEFTCQVCHINFQEMYGELGAGFVEAHHKIPLSSPKAAAETRPEDLVAVCANCHRMLHRLPPHRDGVTMLKRSFTGRWPRRAAS